HMCSLESDLESQMGEFHIKMKGLAGFARLCAGDQYEVLMRYGRQRWRMRGRVEVSSKQIWDSEDNIFLPLITELLSIKVTELKSLANHVVTLAVDINDLGTVKLNLEVTWSPFDKDDQTSSASTMSKRLLSNHSPPDTPSMREQVFYGELDNGTVWSNSSESSDDSSSPALGHHGQRLAVAPPSHALLATPTRQLSFSPRQSSTSTPSLSSNQGEDEPEEAAAETGFSQMLSARSYSVPNGHLQSSKSDSHIGGDARDSVQSAAKARSTSYPSVFSQNATLLEERADALELAECDSSEESISSQEGSQCTQQVTPPPLQGTHQATPPPLQGTHQATPPPLQGTHQTTPPPLQGTHQATPPPLQGTHQATPPLQGTHQATPPQGTHQATTPQGIHQATTPQGIHQATTPQGTATQQPTEDKTTVSEGLIDESASEEQNKELKDSEDTQREVETALESFDFLNCSDLDEDEEEEEEENKSEEKEKEEVKGGESEKDLVEEDLKQQEVGVEKISTGDSDDCQEEEEGEGVELEILMEAPEGFRNSDEDCCYLSQGSSAENLQDVCDVEKLGPPPDYDEEEKKEEDCPSTTSNMADTVS
ncbi:hypothetical protein CRUP_010395, partial [Coryphaenoides rupestris]